MLVQSIFSPQEGESYDRCNVKDAVEYVNTCLETLQLNKRAISADVTCRKLPKTLNRPEGNVANKTIGSVQMILLELKHLQEILETRCYTQCSLKSCMTLDVEHFHSTTHVKNTTMSMLQYCQSFGDCIKESIKRLPTWSAHYFTSPKSWYPLPQGSLKLEDVPLLDPLPAPSCKPEDVQCLIDFANMYGRAVQQRSTRQETTMANAGSLPEYCYADRDQHGDHLRLSEENVVAQENKTVESQHPEYDSDSTESAGSNYSSEAEDSCTMTSEVTREAMFLVGSKSRFSRVVRLNNRFVQ